MSNPLLVRYTKDLKPNEDHPSGMRKGQEFEVATAALANKVHPDAKIVGHMDGTDYEAPVAAEEPKATQKGKD